MRTFFHKRKQIIPLDKHVHTVYTVYTQCDKGASRIDIIIRNTSGQPIYDQIYSQIKDLIISGRLKEGEALPSIRALSKDLRISVITTKRAYDELEKEGFIYTVAAKGCFVAEKNMDLVREENLKRIEDLMQEIGQLAATCGLKTHDLIEMFQLLGLDKEE